MRRHSFVDIVFVAVVGVLASHACVGHVVAVLDMPPVLVFMLWSAEPWLELLFCLFMKLEASCLSLLKSMMMVVLMEDVICMVD